MAKVLGSVTLLSTLYGEEDEKHDCKQEHEANEDEDLKDDSMWRVIAMDLFRPLSVRLRALTNICQSNQNEELCERISTLCGMYQFSQTKELETYLCAIVDHHLLPVEYRIDCAKTLPIHLAYSLVHKMLTGESEKIKQLPTPIRVQTVFFLTDSEQHKQDAREQLSAITCDSGIDCLYRFRVMQTLESHFVSNIVGTRHRRRGRHRGGDEMSNVAATTPADESQREKFLYYARYVAERFVDFAANLFTYRVVACQYILEKCEPDDRLQKKCEEFLLSVAEDVEIGEDVRADACDVILQYGTEEARAAGRRLLFVLGGGEQTRNNIYKNSQNVHVRAIEESVQRIIDLLSAYYPENAKLYTFSEVCDDLHRLLDEEKVEKTIRESVEGALARISIDRAVYGHSNMGLSTILARVWTYIQNSEFREELQKRLIEELVESNEKCSTGYAGRLVNTLSGFDEKMSVGISFEDQIIANLEGRLNARIRLIEDAEEMDKILEEMTIPVIEYDKRSHFLRFFRQHISKIREEMYSEFCGHMDDTDYDFYFRKAIIHYEGCN